MLMAPAVLARVIEGSQQAQEIAMPEVLIPVPLHPLRLRARGFNQALELARVLSREVNIPLCSALVVRHRNTRPQSHLTGSERIKNLKQAFTLACPETRVRWRHAAIIDDVVTTMATCNALAEMMKEEGVKRVDVWAIARAVGN